MPDIEQLQFDRPVYATAVVSTDGANTTRIDITARNANGAQRGPVNMDVLLSDAANGVGLTAVTASGTVQCKTAGTLGTDLEVMTAKKALRVQTLANGNYSLQIVDTAKTPFYVVVQLGGLPSVVAHLATASYG